MTLLAGDPAPRRRGLEPGAAEPLAFVRQAPAFVREALARHAGPGPLVLTVPAPVVDPLRLLALAGDGPVAVFLGPRGRAHVGLGACVTVRAEGERRFEEVRARAGALFAQLAHARHPAAPETEPRLFGGLAFAPGAASAPPWDDFGDARFFLPRLLYGTDARGGWLCLAVAEPARRAAALAHATRALRRALDALASPSLSAVEAPPRPASASLGARAGSSGAVSPMDDPPAPGPRLETEDGAYRAHVAAALEAIGRGELSKVVVARARRARVPAALGLASLLDTLRRDQPRCTVFALRHGQATFAGATPELLVRVEGREVWSEALAGTRPLPGPPAPVPVAAPAPALAPTAKEREEHGLVVDAVASALAPFCGPLRVAPARARRLSRLVHLRTPLRGTLLSGAHLLELAAALHPTPAVGGVPREAALRFIEAHEQAPRGLYASPVGSFDARGSGELWVGLRCALLRADEALLYAGAGVVAGSTPEAEADEARLKLRALLDALGGGS